MALSLVRSVFAVAVCFAHPVFADADALVDVTAAFEPANKVITVAVSFVSAARVSADNIGVNKSTVLPSSFVISGTHNASISGTYNQIAYVCGGLPVYQKGGSDGPVLFMQDGYTFWHVGGPAQATNASGPPGTTNCGYMDPIYLTSGDGFCKTNPADCGSWWSEYPAGNGIPDPADCVLDPHSCHNAAVKIAALASSYMCCCHSVGSDEPSIACEIVDADSKPVYASKKGCGGLKGDGWHSWNTMLTLSKYESFDNVGRCAVPAAQAELVEAPEALVETDVV